MRRIGAILLAAGSSTRLGHPKQLVRIGSENLLERSVRVATEAHCCPILVVLGASSDWIREHSRLDGVYQIDNPDWQEGMASSIRVGINALSDAATDVEGVLVLVCDMPAVTPQHLRALADSGVMTGTSHAGRGGVPAYLPRSVFPALMNLRGDCGAKDLLQDAPSIELSGGELDIDHETDVRIAQQLFGSLPSSPLSRKAR